MTNRLPLPLAALLLAISALLGACASGGPASEHSYLLPAASEPAASDRLPRVRVDVAGYLDQTGLVMMLHGFGNVIDATFHSTFNNFTIF